jgi:FkbM family methyltransferase
VHRAFRLASDLAVIAGRTRDPRLVNLALDDHAAAWEMAWLLRAGHRIEVQPPGYVVRLDGAAFRLSRDELGQGLWAIANRFLAGEYANLDVRDALVVDIGAFIGDTALYFRHRGAYRVLAYEPFAVNFARAAANIELSQAGDRIQLVNAGVGSSSGTLTAAGGVIPSPELVTSPAERGETVRLLSFAEVLADAAVAAGGRRVVCKIDCEGAEFDFLLGAPLPQHFASVSELMMETHRRSPAPLVELLEREGFVVGVDRRPTSLDSELAMVTARR